MNDLINTEDYVGLYLSWIKDNTTIYQISDDLTEITSPLLDRHNDHIQIYVKKFDGGRLRLTDDAYTISDLYMEGIDLSSKQRRMHLESMINGFGIQMNSDELYVEADINSFAFKKHSLMQAMLAVNDLYLTGRSYVKSMFFEDCRSFLETHDIRFSEDILLTGKSGMSHKYNFVIPKSKEQPERLLRAVNNLDDNQTASILFSQQEVLITRPDAVFYTIVNDEHKLKDGNINALRNYNQTVIPFSQREKFVDELTA